MLGGLASAKGTLLKFGYSTGSVFDFAAVGTSTALFRQQDLPECTNLVPKLALYQVISNLFYYKVRLFVKQALIFGL